MHDANLVYRISLAVSQCSVYSAGQITVPPLTPVVYSRPQYYPDPTNLVGGWLTTKISANNSGGGPDDNDVRTQTAIFKSNPTSLRRCRTPAGFTST
jgi:hypothetical protein